MMMVVVCQWRVDEVAMEVRVQRWMMIWMIDGGIDQLLLGAAVLFAAGAALRGWFRTSW